MRKTVQRELDEADERDLLDQALRSLHAGASRSGVTLTKAECLVLLAKLPPWLNVGEARWKQIAFHSHMLERGGVEAAIKKTEQAFGVSRSEVFAARRRLRDYNALVYGQRQ